MASSKASRIGEEYVPRMLSFEFTDAVRIWKCALGILSSLEEV